MEFVRMASRPSALIVVVPGRLSRDECMKRL